MPKKKKGFTLKQLSASKETKVVVVGGTKIKF